MIDAHHGERRWDAIIALGSNIGDKAGHISAAIAALTAPGDVRLIEASANYRTAPWGVVDQDWFVNAAISVATDLDVNALLARCQAVEVEIGRRRTIRWGPRVIDLDILFYRDLVLNEPDLVLPHPQIKARSFVLRPLQDVAPTLRIEGQPLSHWLSLLPPGDIVPLKQETGPLSSSGTGEDA